MDDSDSTTIDSNDAMVPGMPARYKHCCAVYDAMHERSERTAQGLIYTGSLTNLITQDLGLGNAYYTVIMSKLKDMGCVEMLRRGGGPSPSVWLLRRAPTPEAYNTAERRDVLEGTISKADREVLKQRQTDLERRIAHVEDVLRNLGAPV